MTSRIFAYLSLCLSVFRSLTSRTNFTFEANRKDTPCTSFFLNRKPTPVQLQPINITDALGIPPSRGMFKTPTPTPPSSHDSSPLVSPRLPVMHSQCFCTSGSVLQVPQISRHGRHQQQHSHHNGSDSPKNLKFTFDVTSCDLKLDVISSSNSRCTDNACSDVTSTALKHDVSRAFETHADRLKRLSRRFSDQTTTRRRSGDALTLYFRASYSTPTTPHPDT